MSLNIPDKGRRFVTVQNSGSPALRGSESLSTRAAGLGASRLAPRLPFTRSALLLRLRYGGLAAGLKAPLLNSYKTIKKIWGMIGRMMGPIEAMEPIGRMIGGYKKEINGKNKGKIVDNIRVWDILCATSEFKGLGTVELENDGEITK